MPKNGFDLRDYGTGKASQRRYDRLKKLVKNIDKQDPKRKAAETMLLEAQEELKKKQKEK